jgi:hypothetical protein
LRIDPQSWSRNRRGLRILLRSGDAVNDRQIEESDVQHLIAKTTRAVVRYGRMSKTNVATSRRSVQNSAKKTQSTGQGLPEARVSANAMVITSKPARHSAMNVL